MNIRSISILRRPSNLLIVWTILLLISFILLVFMHEDGHGLGAKIDGVHVSTGFNKVGDYGKSPSDPDFRATQNNWAFWGGVLGPVIIWVMAIVFTIWLYRMNGPSWSALIIGALAVVSGLIRALPMVSVMISALLGKPYLEDEVGWGIWYVLKYCRPELASLSLDYHTLLSAYPQVFLKDYSFWISPMISLAVSLGCLVPAYLRIYKVWRNSLNYWVYRVLFGLLPVATYIAILPVLNWLDRFIRINW